MPNKALLSLLLILVLDLGLRLSAITFDSMYLDESFQSMYESVGEPLYPFMLLRGQPILFRFPEPRPLGQLLQHFRDVDPLCPPLYGVLLNRWMAFWGESDLAIRCFSAMFSVLADAATAIFACLMLGFPAGLLAALVQALSPSDVYYGQEARMYALVLFAATVSMGSAYMLATAGRFKERALWIGLYSVATWAMINAHYTSLFIVLFQVPFFTFVSIWRRSLRLFMAYGFSWVLCLLLWVPWLGMFAQAASLRHGGFFISRQPSFWWPITTLLLTLPKNAVSFLWGNKLVIWTAPIIGTAVIMTGLGVYAALALLRGEGKNSSLSQSSKDQQLAGLLLVSWAVLPSVFLWLTDVIETRRVVEMARYSMGTAPALYFLAGLGLFFLLKSGYKRSFMILLAVHSICALASITVYHLQPQRRPWRQMAAKVESTVPSNDIVLVSQYYDIVCLDRYLNRPVRQIGLSPSMGAPSINQLILGLAPLNHFWLVSAEADGERVVPLLPGQYKLKDQFDLPHDLHLRLFERPSNDVKTPVSSTPGGTETTIHGACPGGYERRPACLLRR